MSLKENARYYLSKYTTWLISNTLFSTVNRYYYSRKKGFTYHHFNMNNPIGFTEKVVYTKDKMDLFGFAKYADKYLVRDYIKETIGENYLVPAIKYINSAEEFKLAEMPQKFIIKATHGSGMNKIVKNKSSENEIAIRKIIRFWLSRNLYYYFREPQYKNIKPGVIIEELVGDGDVPPADYKFYCFHGKPLLLAVDIDRGVNHKRDMYDINWNKLPVRFVCENSTKALPKPKDFDEMLEIAAKLSAPFKFVRVDTYNIDGKIYVGELTFHPYSGAICLEPYEYDIALGKMLTVKD